MRSTSMLAMDGRDSYIAFVTQPGLMTADELRRLRLPGKRTELVRGALVVHEPAGLLHGTVAARLAGRIIQHVEKADLGVVCAAETGFKLRTDPDTVRAPDVAFISRERVPDPVPTGYADFAPDLAVEVLSPDDRPGAILAKVADWLNAGVRLVWVVDPQRRLVRVYRLDGSELLLAEGETLAGEDVLPGFSCPVVSLF